MREQDTVRQQRLTYEKTLYSYSTALERGDFDTIIAILHEAEHDAILEQLLLEMHHEGYECEESAMIQELQPPEPQHKTKRVVSHQPSRASSRQTRKPRARWLRVLQGFAAVLIVVTISASALLLFSSIKRSAVGQQQNTQRLTETYSDMVVIADIASSNSSKKSGTVTALDARTGAKLWHVSFSENVDNNERIGLVIEKHIVYVASNRQVLALQARNGNLLWKTSLGAEPQVFAVDDMPRLIVKQGRVYASGYSAGNLSVLDANTGKVLWQYKAPTSALLAISNNIAYVIADGTHIKALDGKDGHMLWTQDVHSTPLSATVAGNVFYVQTAASLADDPDGYHKDQKPLIAMNATTGQTLWSIIAPAGNPTDLVVTQGVIVLFNGDRFCGYRSSDGSQAWCSTNKLNSLDGTSITIEQGVIYGLVNSSFQQNTLTAINPKDGSVYWSKTFDAWVQNHPPMSVFGEYLILPQSLLMLNRSNGTILWHFPNNFTRGNILQGTIGQ